MPRPGCFTARAAFPPRSSASRICRRRRCSTVASGTCGSPPLITERSSTSSRPPSTSTGTRPSSSTMTGSDFLAQTAAPRDTSRDALARTLRLRPYPHQEEVLAALAEERRAGHTRNLVVAATGTGKTVVAALDYARIRAERGEASLLVIVVSWGPSPRDPRADWPPFAPPCATATSASYSWARSALCGASTFSPRSRRCTRAGSSGSIRAPTTS